MNMEWVSQWRKQRLLGIVKHAKQEVLEQISTDPNLMPTLIANAKNDPLVMKVLQDNGVKFE